jgi:hypothetical protein
MRLSETDIKLWLLRFRVVKGAGCRIEGKGYLGHVRVLD